jgi:ribosomal protein S18 acetylase RimI-like enzyme
MTAATPHTLRFELRDGDEDVVRSIVESTDFFSPAEINIAVELVQERRAKGDASGYHFVFLDDVQDGQVRTIGYTCYGAIDGTQSSYDLYWIAVDDSLRGRGLGRVLMQETERRIAAAGGRRIYVDTSSRATYVPTRAFYERSGYLQEALLADFYAPGDGKVIFCKVVGN